jgi:hypothetical protein
MTTGEPLHDGMASRPNWTEGAQVSWTPMSLASTHNWTPKDKELFTSVLKALAKYWNVKVEGVDSDLSRLYQDKWEWEDK